MIKKTKVIFSIFFLVLNSIVFLIIRLGYLPLNGSINLMLSLYFSNMFDPNNYLFGSIIYITLTTLLIYGLASTAHKTFEKIILTIIILFTSIPFINLSGL